MQQQQSRRQIVKEQVSGVRIQPLPDANRCAAQLRTAGSGKPNVDIEAVMNNLASQSKEKLNWKT